MRSEEMARLLRAQPFRPFRLRLSNGEVYEVRHPEMAIITQYAVYIGVPAAGGPPGVAEDIANVALMHVNQMEYLAPPASSATN